MALQLLEKITFDIDKQDSMQSSTFCLNHMTSAEIMDASGREGQLS